MNQEPTKKCSKCSQIKPLSQYTQKKTRKDGHTGTCKDCDHESGRQYRLKNVEKIRNRRNNPQRKKHEKIYGKRYRLKHPRAAYYVKNKVKLQEYHRNYYLSHKTAFKQYSINSQSTRNHYQYKKRQNDSNFQLLSNLRTRMSIALKNNQKRGYTINLLMCTILEWKQHLEKQFTKGMSWSNYGNKTGQWNVDHILPCSFFNLSDPVEQYMCFNYTNTQPMWHLDNVRKSDNLSPNMINNSKS